MCLGHTEKCIIAGCLTALMVGMIDDNCGVRLGKWYFNGVSVWCYWYINDVAALEK